MPRYLAVIDGNASHEELESSVRRNGGSSVQILSHIGVIGFECSTEDLIRICDIPGIRDIEEEGSMYASGGGTGPTKRYRVRAIAPERIDGVRLFTKAIGGTTIPIPYLERPYVYCHLTEGQVALLQTHPGVHKIVPDFQYDPDVPV